MTLFGVKTYAFEFIESVARVGSFNHFDRSDSNGSALFNDESLSIPVRRILYEFQNSIAGYAAFDISQSLLTRFDEKSCCYKDKKGALLRV